MAIRKFTTIVGKMVATESRVDYAPLYFKPLEKIKKQELQIHAGNYDSSRTIPISSIPMLHWWMEKISTCYEQISCGKPDMLLFSDASTKARDGFDQSDNVRTGWGMVN